MESVLMFATVLSPVVAGVVELIKRTVTIRKNLIPLLSFGVGLLIGVISYPFTDFELIMRLWSGGISGLAAVGLFEIQKCSIREIEKRK
ncbi:holin [Evansella halocellulosilytica]|uniref:holin n=1 Tax=Evansella halocellulosilytica TaxID=2011013 RepID=UPI000BB8E8D9|nr:holin [Evansella halocellulosilytica]